MPGGDGGGRFALDNLSDGHEDFLEPVGLGMPHEMFERPRRFKSEDLVVDADAGDGRIRVVADEFVVVDAENRYLLRDLEARLLAGVNRLLCADVIGREDGCWTGKGLEPRVKRSLGLVVDIAGDALMAERSFESPFAQT